MTVRALEQTDPWSGLLNDAGFAAVLAREAERATLEGLPLALLSLRLDGFAPLPRDDDSALGELLRELGRLARGVCEDALAVARLGKERVAILVRADLPGARAIADTLVRIVAATPFSAPFSADGQTCVITLSAGVATFAVHEGAAALVRASCAAMESAATRGGNCVG